ncbi:interferon-induced very large GTPase 1-like [Dendronephthya gigantea]|uniref:interferon-induced very large GTPase 1-like n=1 Tax=Dendronephthya gigantea TaxID=151771 RepID=UPI00106D1ABF|nr:interferon-induced very large GTPase 1-like [Dendronephthya gigantea]
MEKTEDGNKEQKDEIKTSSKNFPKENDEDVRTRGNENEDCQQEDGNKTKSDEDKTKIIMTEQSFEETDLNDMESKNYDTKAEVENIEKLEEQKSDVSEKVDVEETENGDCQQENENETTSAEDERKITMTEHLVEETDKEKPEQTASKDQSPDALATSGALFKLCNELNLKPDSKFTLKHARTIDNHTLTDEKLKSPEQIPEYIFKTILMANYHVRKFKITQDISRTKQSEDSDDSEDEDEGVNPMDALLCIFYFSDDSLRRYLALKLATCQLSIPFLLPDPKMPSENVTMLLSSVEGITKSWKDSPEIFVTEYPFPVVSFIRIGKVTTSKSSLINKIMSDGSNHHDFFFHKDMEGGHFERKIVDGLVEMSWYLPGESEKQTCQNEICFMNLRGDAGVLKKQRNVLSKISSVLCILIPSEYPDETSRKILEEAMDDKAKIILIFLEKPGQEAKQYFKLLEGEKLASITRSKRANEHEFVKIIQEKVIGKLQDIQTTPLRNLASLASEHCINYNIGQTQTKFEENVDKWLKIGIKEAKDHLKLQLHVPVLADLEREKYRPRGRGTKSLKDDMDKIYKKIKNENKNQKKSFKQLDRRFLDFLDFLSKMNVTERVKALCRLKHQLNKMSLRVMAELHGEDQKKQAATSQELKEKRLKHSREKSRSSFGLEHIIRELAQLYQLRESKYDFADVAAEMLLSGQSLELVDGDSSYIPLRWFEAVYTKLEKKTKNATIFVISVLGIQSSGKSTMLNTMFGLEFPVSVGRCTRGAFVSLIPVSDSLKIASKFDYVLIVDTEGLSGSGDPKVREHDNELATFVIGVADLTIVNIMGENHNEIKEFLEISMHAFLKMKLVKEKRICKIVHQNVAATDARDKLTDDRLKLKKDLDKMAKLAAIQENCEEEIQKLDDIISFNENEDVFYIPSLLQGNPPMAPVNPNYGRAIQKVKESIISLISSKHGFQLSIAQFRERVCNLWNAMLKENFIFNFRNVIEVRAYAALDRKYFEESVNLMVTGMTELKTRIEVALSRCTTREEREKEWKESRKQIWSEAANLAKKMERVMKRFFEENEDKATLEQWRENTMLKIKQMEENQKLEVTTYCSEAFRYLQNRQDVDEKKQSFEKEILHKAKKFITSAQNTDDAKKCLAAFEQEWEKWMAEIPHYQESKTDVADVMVNVLCETNPALNAEMTEKIKSQNYKILNFKKSPVLRYTSSSLVQRSVQTMAKFFNLFNKQQDSSGRNINDQAVDCALDFAEKKAKSGVRCTRNDLIEMYQKVITTLDKEAEKSCFKFDDLFKCDILLYAFAHTYDIFEKMEQRYLEERNIKGDLEKNLRPRLETYFKNLCDKMGKEMSAATSFVDVLRTPIESALNRAMGPAVAKEVLKVSKFQSKGQFHASVLIELGKEAEFKSYIPYLQNPVKFLRAKLMESIEDYCINENPDSIISVLRKEVDKLKEDVSTGISSAKEETENHGEKLTFWIQQFVSKCSSLAITKEMFAVAAIDDDLKDIDVFETQVEEKINDFFVSLIERGIDDFIMREWDPSPHDHLFSSIFGCQSCCPFCKGLCDQTNQNHPGSHSTRIHRAQGLSGYHSVDTKILRSTICTNDVANEKRRFRNKETAGEWHYYKDYQSVNDYYKSWQIPGDESFELSKYWQWFMANFSEELANFYEVEKPKIPSTWHDRTFEEVEHDLRQEYNMLLVVNEPSQPTEPSSP